MGGKPGQDVPRKVAFGPVAPGWGSWNWVGADVAKELGTHFEVSLFNPWEVPESDVVVVVKHRPPPEWAAKVAGRARVVYAPVDAYGSAAEIDGDASWLRRCSVIVIHCERLRRYLAPYSPVEFMDHHVKFAAPMRDQPTRDGRILWAGVRSNLGPLVRWVNANSLPAPLDVLTNPETPGQLPTAREIGFRPGIDVEIHEWTPERHLAMTTTARAMIDIKGDDFRARHKPPAKAIDAIASGLPLAMNEDSSPVEHLARMGFDVASARDWDWWLSAEYAEETRRFGAAIGEVLSRERIARRWKRILGG